ncbi:hypothetical protein O0I10_004654 [Lichtheimia ornata]|uniref:ubiquitinyl hydrolase 1 n=1 Tax=Lichtheimia ornata TaxID=688661 RepID=A0AAD7XZ18_9FUNG|nr:uncharacterized protein O0I10_004654 [Lichtheimia ornata]KAJ8659675.1 hypothetical protein O0I10_004654 [Lichtheimia ornata]
MDLVPFIHFEKQEGLLCAQHALNALLQGSYFTAVDLATIGQKLDERERAVVGSSTALQQGCNYDDSGYFSIQVIQEALSVWDLELIPWRSEEAADARDHPENEVAYVCHLDQHWFTLRKFSVPWRWYNLNSTQSTPILVSETYLGMLLSQIQNENYSVFVVRGTLPTCEADQIAPTLPNPSTAPNESPTAFSGQGYSLVDNDTENGIIDNEDDEEIQLAKAIEASLQPQEKSVDMDEMRRKRLARFG